jgi:hypothetical protein
VLVGSSLALARSRRNDKSSVRKRTEIRPLDAIGSTGSGINVRGIVHLVSRTIGYPLDRQDENLFSCHCRHGASRASLKLSPLQLGDVR